MRGLWAISCGAFLAGVGLTCLVGANAQNQDQIQAHRIVVIDKAGNQRIILDASDENGTGIVLKDKKGEPRISLMINSIETASIALFKNSEVVATIIAPVADKFVGLALGKGPQSQGIWLQNDGKISSLDFMDSAGRKRMILVSSDRGSYMNLKDTNGVSRVDLSQIGATKPGQEDGASVSICGPDKEDSRAMMSTFRGQSTMTIFGPGAFKYYDSVKGHLTHSIP